MTVKVSLLSSKIRRQYTSIIAIISAVASFYLISIDVDDKDRIKYIVFATTALIAIYILIWVRANFKKSARLSINNSSLEIIVGDIFDQDGLKTIGFNEYYDTKVDDKLISKSSLHGLYLTKFYKKSTTDLDSRIQSSERLMDRTEALNNKRRIGNKQAYRLGSVFVDGDYLLVAFSKFDNENRAQLSLKEYVSCLVNFWDEVDQVYAGRSISVPLLGSGITRFKDADIQPQELLSIMIWTFKVSRVKFKHPAKASIIIHKDMVHKINFYELG